MKADAIAPLHVTTDSACAALGIGKTKLFELIASGELETITIGRRRLVPVCALHDFSERLRSHMGSPGA